MTAQVTVFADNGIPVAVVQGSPPVDQTALVASLQASVAQLTSDRDLVAAQRDVAVSSLAAMTAARDALGLKIANAQTALA